MSDKKTNTTSEGEVKPYLKENPTLERGVKTYLPPLVYRYFQGYVAHTEESESSAAADMIKAFFDRMPADEKQFYLKFGGNNPSKNSY